MFQIRYSARTLRKTPVFTLTVILTIALGIGASTAIFSLVDATLLRPLPYRAPERLTVLRGEWRQRNLTEFPFSNTDFFDVRNGAVKNFDDFAAVRTGRAVIPKDDGSLEQVSYGLVTPAFFQILGAPLSRGRDFEQADGEVSPPGGDAPPSKAILSYEYWQRNFGGDSAAIGRGLLNRGSSGPQIVGVLAPHFELLLPPTLSQERNPDHWVAARLPYDVANRNVSNFRIIARLRGNAKFGDAAAELESVAAGIRNVDPIRKTADFHIRLEPMREYLIATARPIVMALMGAVILLLIIGCANVANLMLVRTASRERELSVRAALGATWRRIVAQVLTEALLLACVGTLLGIGLAWAGIRALAVILPALVTGYDPIALNARVLAFGALAGLITAVLCGLLPAVRASKPSVMSTLRAGGRSIVPGTGIFSSGIVVTEVALSFVLLIGSGLMVRSMVALTRVDPGFAPDHVLTFRLLGRWGNQPEQRAQSLRDMQDRLRAIPGVLSVSAANSLPLDGSPMSATRWGPEEAAADPSRYRQADFRIVLPGYSETLKTRLIAGRTFTSDDNSTDRHLVIIDESLAAIAFPNQSAVGRHILIRRGELVEIIGVVAHERLNSIAEAGREQMYMTDGYWEHGAVVRWALRTAGDPAQFAAPVRDVIAKAGSRWLITEMQPMDALVESAGASTRSSLLLMGALAAVAMLLAVIGLYGVLSAAVRQRTAEIGIRMALGATPANIFRSVVGRGLLLSAIGIAIGLALAFELTRFISSMLVGVGPNDPWTFGLVAALFLTIAGVASGLPAYRGATLDQTMTLRDE